MKKINIVVAALVMAAGISYGQSTVKSYVIPTLVNEINAAFSDAAQTAGAKAGVTVTASENDAFVNSTVLTLANTPVSVVYGGDDTNAVGSTKIYDFPAGRILVLGAIVDSFLITSFPTNTMDAADNGDFAFGTAVPDADGVLNGTAVDIIPATAIDLLTSTNSAALAVSAQFDGTTTAKDLHVNLSIDHGDLTGASTNAMTVGGTVTVHWINLGDY